MGNRRGPDRVYPQALKLAAVERMEAATNITALSRELGIQRELLYVWRRRYRAEGVAGLRERGGGKRAMASAVVPKQPRRTGAHPGARIAELERKVGQQALELDFFRAALKHFGKPSRPEDEASETDSTP